MAVTVYEVRNSTLMELYVGISDIPFAKLSERHRFRQLRPKALHHWDYDGQRVLYAEIDHKLPDEDARVFFESYRNMVKVPDWTTLRD